MEIDEFNSKVIKYLQNYTVPILRRLIKIFICKENNYIQYAEDIYRFVHCIPVCIQYNALPTCAIIYSTLFPVTISQNFDDFVISYLNVIAPRHDIELSDYQLTSLRLYCIQYLEWLSIQLSAVGIVTKGEVFAQLGIKMSTITDF